MFALLMGLRTISPADVSRMVQERRVTVLDLNAPGRWAEAHVPGAMNLDPLNWSEHDLPADKGASLVFYCSNPLCRKAPNAARRARDMGYRDVRVMSAGIQGWLSAGLPTESAPETQ